MAAEKPYMILVCDPGRAIAELEDGDQGRGGYAERLLADEWWQAHGPIMASSGGQAIEKLWELAPEMKVNTALLYHPVANFKPKRQRRSFIERWSLDDAKLPDEQPPGQTELVT